MKKQFFRVKQIADQTFLRAEKSEVLGEELQGVEKHVDLIRQICNNTWKKMSACLHSFGSEVPNEKKLKKMPEIALASAMSECSAIVKGDSLLGFTLAECATIQESLGKEKLAFENEVERLILNQISNLLDNDLPNIVKIRKQLARLTLDMDSARTRYVNAVRHSQQVTGAALVTAANKVELLKEELEEASSKVEQIKDSLAAEMFALISKEPEISKLFIKWYRLQISYHQSVINTIEAALPALESTIEECPQRPVFGYSLNTHLQVSERQIAWVLETCVCFLLECGFNEEGLFRIAGSASKVKKLKNSFDAGMVDMTEYLKDPHAVAGVLKSYLRELPDSLLTGALYEPLMAASRVSDNNERLKALWSAIQQLPQPNFNNLRYLMKFFSKFSTNCEVNKMSSQNLAIVLAPNLIWSTVEDKSQYIGINMNAANAHSSIVESLISYANWFFPEDIDFYITVTPFLADHKPSNGDVEIELSTDSSRVFHKPCKKPAPPVPPLANCSEKNAIGRSSSFNSGEFKLNSPFLPEEKTNEKIPPANPPEKPERASVAVTKPEKPNVPEKPAFYSTMSLERPVKQRTSKTERSDSSRFSVIERPTVPPPERPLKSNKPVLDPNPGSFTNTLLAYVDESDPEEENIQPATVPSSESQGIGDGPPDRPPRNQISEDPFPEAQKIKPLRPPPIPPAKPKILPSPEDTHL